MIFFEAMLTDIARSLDCCQKIEKQCETIGVTGSVQKVGRI